MYAYRNKSTGAVVTSSVRRPRFENDAVRWETTEVPDANRAQANEDRKAAELDLIDATARRRFNETALRHESRAEKLKGIKRTTELPPAMTVDQPRRAGIDPGPGDGLGVLERGHLGHDARVHPEQVDTRDPEDAKRGVLTQQALKLPATGPIITDTRDPDDARKGVLSQKALRPDSGYVQLAGAWTPEQGDTASVGDGEHVAQAEAAEAVAVKPPSKSASKPELVAWCVEHRHEDEAELDGLTKDVLWDRINEGPIPAPPA